MTSRVFTKRLWLHKDLDLPGNFNEIFKSRTEPLFDDEEKTAVLSHEAHCDGDIFTHVTTPAKSLFPKQLWEWVGFGEKVELEISIKASKKSLDEPITEMITKAVEEDKGEGEEYVKAHDRLIFTLADESVIHERQYILYTPFADGSGRKNVEYINSYGEIIRHPETEHPDDCYVMLGHVGDRITPLAIGRIWGNEKSPKSCLKEVLIKAYQHGLRFEEAPDTDEIVFYAHNVRDKIIGLSCYDGFYGFGENMTFCSTRDYQENTKLGTRGLDHNIINVIVAYRWFFNKPNLFVKLDKAKGKVVNEEKMAALCCLINKKINEKFAKLEKKSPCFDPMCLRTKTLIIPYAEENVEYCEREMEKRENV